MKAIEQINKKLEKTKSFKVATGPDDFGMVTAYAYSNYLIAMPLTAESERQIKSNPYTRLLKTKKHCFALYYFPSAVHSRAEREANAPNFSIKMRTRLQNLFKSREEGQIRLMKFIELPEKEFYQIEYVAKPYDKSKSDFQDDMVDTVCRKLAELQLKFRKLESVSLTYNTVLILKNAREQKNNSLSYYRKLGVKTFYTDCIINYILEHSGLLQPESFKYENTPHEVHILARKLLKLYPHGSYKLEAPEGVTINNITRPDSQRFSKNDTIVFNFSDKYLKRFKSIIMREETNMENPESFIKVPMFFVMHALRTENLTSRGYNFLLWLLPFFRIKNPKIFHSLKTILNETGADITHGYKKPLATLNKYFDYLYRINTFYNIQAPVKFSSKNINSPPRFNGALLELRKPKPPKD